MTRQNLALYVNAPECSLTIQLNDKLLYDDLRPGHSASLILNPWLESGENTVRIVASVPQSSARLTQLGVELFLHEGEEDTGVIVVEPEPTEPAEEIIVPEIPGGPPQSVTRVYQFNTDDINLGSWLNTVPPWQAAAENRDQGKIFSLYRDVLGAFEQDDLGEIMELASARLKFFSQKMQYDPNEFGEKFKVQIQRVLGCGHSLKRPASPETEMHLFPIKEGLIYRIQWASGGPAIHTRPDEQGFQQGFEMTVCHTNSNGWTWVL